MLDECVDLALQHNALLCTTGDLFHIKRPQYVSHALIQKVINILSRLGVPLMGVAGNHDLTERGVDSVDTQPIGVLCAAGVLRLIDLVDTKKWRILGRHYSTHREALPSYYTTAPHERTEGANRPTLMLAHGSIIPPGQVRPYPIITCTDLDMTGINVLCSGHIHEDLGIYPMSEGPGKPIKVFANVGALARVARTEANRTRVVKALGIGLEGTELTLRELPLTSALPSDDIFEDVVEDNVQSEDITEAVAALSSFVMDDPTTNLLGALDSLDLPAQVKALAIAYLEEADAES